jgi:hypothetical protein
MHEKIADMETQAHLRNLAMQMVIQMQPLCHSKDDACEVLRIASELVDWQYGKAALRGLKIVG